ncbi:MAG: hypothetical protein ACJ0HK_05470 [Akkermansiaceae bacterium]|nr:hypothetical protein [Verrucomicrobiales bacterium]HCN81790.1 hypothetical protein [Verrucomicrobiales bacterium]
MFSLKHNLMLLPCSLLCFSCTMLRPSPPSPTPENLPVAQAVDPLFPNTSGQFGTEAQLKEARDRANAEANARRERLQNEQLATGINPDSGTTDVIQPIPREPIKRVSKYRTARAIVTKPGYVFNPWTNKAVDVRGIPSGTLIRDPNDGDPDHKFRVP